MKEPTCPNCGTPLEWSAKLRRYLPCHRGEVATAVIRTEDEARQVARLLNHDARAVIYRRDIDRDDALYRLIAAACAVEGHVDAVAGEELLGDLSRALAAYDAVAGR